MKFQGSDSNVQIVNVNLNITINVLVDGNITGQFYDH